MGIYIIERPMIQYLLYLSLAIGGIAFRLLPHPANFTPIGAIALFGGFYFARGKGWLAVLPILCISDALLGFYDWKLMVAVYGSFLLFGWLGVQAKKQYSLTKALILTLTGSTTFYLITNFAVWIFSPWYPHTAAGLVMSYVMALPFFRASLAGDILFSGILFGAYELVLVFQPFPSFDAKFKGMLDRHHFRDEVGGIDERLRAIPSGENNVLHPRQGVL